MPYRLRKVPKKDLYWVIGPDGKHHSKEGMPLDKAKAQMRVLEAAVAKEGSGTHKENVVKTYDLPETNSLQKLSDASAVPMAILRKVYNRGIGAYSTQPSSVRLKGSFVKNVDAPMDKKLSKEQWAMARVYSFLDGNTKHDNDLRRNLKTFDLKGGDKRAAIAGIPLKTYYEAAKASYAAKNNHQPPREIGDGFTPFKLIHHTRTLVFYVHDSQRSPKVLVGIRGTDANDSKDLGADALVATNSLTSSDRYKHDLVTIKAMDKKYPHNDYTWLGAAHSLGGALLDHFIKDGFIDVGVSYNPAVEKPFYNTTKNHRIYNEHDPLYWFMGSYAKVYDVRKDTRPSDWVDYVSWIVPWWKVGYTALSAHKLSNFEGGMRGQGKEYCEYAPDKFNSDGTRILGQEGCADVGGVWDRVANKCKDIESSSGSKVVYYEDECRRPADPFNPEEEDEIPKDEYSISKEVVEGIKDKQKNDEDIKRAEEERKRQEEEENPPDPFIPPEEIPDNEYSINPQTIENIKEKQKADAEAVKADEERKREEEELKKRQEEDARKQAEEAKKKAEEDLKRDELNNQRLTEKMKSDCNAGNIKSPYLGRPAKDIGDPTIPQSYRDLDFRVYHKEDCDYLKGTFFPFSNNAIASNDELSGRLPLWRPDTQEIGTQVITYVKTLGDKQFLDKETVENAHVRELKHNWYKKGDVVWYNNKKWEAVDPQLVKPGVADNLKEGIGWERYPVKPTIKLRNTYSVEVDELDQMSIWKPNVYYSFKRRVAILVEERRWKSDKPFRYKAGDYEIWWNINQQNIPPAEPYWKEVPLEEWEKDVLNRGDEQKGDFADELLWESREPSYVQTLKDMVSDRWGDCVVNGKDMNSYCRPLNSEPTPQALPPIKPELPNKDAVDAELNTLDGRNGRIGITSEQNFNSLRTKIAKKIEDAKKLVGKTVRMKSGVQINGVYPIVKHTYTQEDVDNMIKKYEEGSLINSQPPSRLQPTTGFKGAKPIMDYKDYQEYYDLVKQHYNEKHYEYSDEQKQELAKREPKCPESLKWDKSRPYKGSERVCIEAPDPNNIYATKNIITTVDKALGLDKKTECYLPPKPGGRKDFGPDILVDDKGTYVMATPEECYAKQMARFADVSRDDWYQEGIHTMGSWWRKYGLKVYDDLTQMFGQKVSEGIQSAVTRGISNVLNKYTTDDAYEKKKEAAARTERQSAMEKDLKDIFANKFGISPEKRDQFWADYFKVAQQGGDMAEFFNNFGSTYSNSVFKKLAEEAETEMNRVREQREKAGQTDWRSPFSPNYNPARVADEENAIRNLAERSTSSAPITPSGQNEPPPTRPPGGEPDDDLFGGAELGWDDFSGLLPFSGKMDGLLPAKGEFWTNPKAFVHKINEKLGLTGKTETEEYAEQNPNAKPQREPIEIRGEPEKTVFNVNKAQPWNDRADELLKRRRYMMDWFPSKSTLGYEPKGSQFNPATGMNYEGKGKAKTAFVRELESEGISPAKYLAEAQKKAKKAGLNWKSLTWATDGKHKLVILDEERPVRFGASGMGDHIFYKQAGDPTAAKHRKAYRARATKIKGNWASNKYSPNSLALAVLW
jgi:hypothetical protein